MASPVCQQLFPIPKAPSHTDGSHPAIHGGLHIHTGISHVKHFLFSDTCRFYNIIDNRRIRLYRYSLPLPEYKIKMPEYKIKKSFAKICGDKGYGCFMVFIGCHG